MGEPILFLRIDKGVFFSPDGLLYLIIEMPSFHPTDSQKVGKGPYHSIADIVLCCPKPPGSVVHLDLSYHKTFHLCEGVEKPMHAVEQLQVLKTLTSKCLQGTACIHDFLMAQLIPHKVGNLRGYNLDPRISSFIPPPTDYIELPYLFQKAGYIIGIILEVVVHRHNYITLGDLKTGVEGRCLTRVLFEADQPYL